MVFSMNVFKNKKRWKNIKNVKNVKKRALNKKRKNRFFTSMACSEQSLENLLTMKSSDWKSCPDSRQTSRARMDTFQL